MSGQSLEDAVCSCTISVIFTTRIAGVRLTRMGLTSSCVCLGDAIRAEVPIDYVFRKSKQCSHQLRPQCLSVFIALAHLN